MAKQKKNPTSEKDEQKLSEDIKEESTSHNKEAET